MLYKTKKQIFHFIRIILFIIASVVFYTIMAHQNKLPALFEKYTGEIVREKTKSYYNEFFLEKSEVELVTEKERLKNKFFWDSIDYISREPGYIKASDILNSIASNIENLPKNKINNLLDLKSDPALVSWLSNQKGNFASLYRYEVIRKIDSYRYISSWAVLDENKKVIWSSKGYKASHIELEMEENNVSAAVDRFTIAVEKDKKIIGYMQGIWDIWKFPDLPFAGNQGSGIFGFIINHENKIISPSFIPAAYQRFTAENSTKYIGLYGGRMYPYRFITKTAGNINILLIYPSVSFAFYIFKVLLYFFILIAVLVFIRYIKKLRVLLKESGILSQKKWLEESLKQALTLNQNTVELAAQSQSLIHTIKQREQLTLAGLANKITMLPNMLAESIQPASQKSLKLLGEVILSGKELYEKPVKKSFTQLQEIPSLTESRFIHDDEEIKDKKIKITEMPDKVKDIEIEKRREDDKKRK
ncbi:MAG: cache domain-containing protein [Spirochaetia bacterium]|nr:cache domain-containing protein [Spirochaetia bacterium]